MFSCFDARDVLDVCEVLEALNALDVLDIPDVPDVPDTDVLSGSGSGMDPCPAGLPGVRYRAARQLQVSLLLLFWR